MNLAEMVAILVSVFVALLVVLWLMMASSKSTPCGERKPTENVGSGVTLVDSDESQKAAAEQQSKTTTAVAAWWWLNHGPGSKGDDTKKEK